MAFDVDAFRAAHRPWSFTVGGRTFGAKHVSALKVAEYERRAADASALYRTNPARGSRAQLAALRWLLRFAFPWRIDYLLRGNPVAIILSLEPAARAEALRDFFASLQGKTTPTTTPLPSTSGTPSSAPTPPRSPYMPPGAVSRSTWPCCTASSATDRAGSTRRVGGTRSMAVSRFGSCGPTSRRPRWVARSTRSIRRVESDSRSLAKTRANAPCVVRSTTPIPRGKP